MEKEKIKEWIRELKHPPKGVYQIRGKFSNQNGGYCALGVGAVQLSIPRPWNVRAIELGFGIPEGICSRIIGMNDINHDDFNKIAEFLEGLLQGKV